MKIKPTISELIRIHLKDKKFEFLEGSLDLGYEKLPHTLHFRKLLKNGYLAFGDYSRKQNDYVKAIHAYDRARQMAPHNWVLISRELSTFEEFIKRDGDKGVKRDFEILRVAATIIRYQYKSGKYSRWISSVLNSIEIINDGYKDKARAGVESQITFRIESLIERIYCDLTKDQREGIVNEIVPYLPDLLRKSEELERSKKSKSKRSKKDSKT